MYVVIITINAYQGSSVYIDAYDADSSHTYMLTLAAEDIPALLVPNGSILSKGVLTQPTTPTEMYSQLLDLLHLEKSGNKRLQERWRNLNDTLHSKKTDFKGQLVIRRDYSFLRNCSTKMNGHRVLVKVKKKYIHTYIHIYTYIHILLFTATFVQIHSYSHSFIHTYIHTTLCFEIEKMFIIFFYYLFVAGYIFFLK